MLWSYAKMGHHHETLFTAAAEHTVRTISAFQPQSVVSPVMARFNLSLWLVLTLLEGFVHSS